MNNITNIKEFTDALLDKLVIVLPDMIIKEVEVNKCNGQNLTGLTFKPKGGNVAPTVYVNDAYDAFNKGESLVDIVSNVVDEVNNAAAYAAEMEKMGMRMNKYESAKARLGVRVLDLDRNKAFAEDKPYKDLGNGLGLFADVRFPNDDGFSSAMVNNDLMEQWGINKDTLWEDAFRSAEEIASPVFQTLEHAMFGGGCNLLEEPWRDNGSNMYVLTNAVGSFGASAMFMPHVAYEISTVLGGSYYALPSSVHEFIVVPEAAGIDVNALKAMVYEGNRTVCEDKDVLCDSLFFYNKDKAELEVA